MKRTRIAVLLAVSLVSTGWLLQSRTSGKEQGDPALERTRKTVRMLDDLYKTAVVYITDKYVHADTDVPAGTAAKALFTAMKKKGWPETKLLDLSGEPLVATNVPQDAFEKAAAREILAGKAAFDQVEQTKQGRVLHAATTVPVVMQKCVMCHPNYATVKAGKAIAMLTYTLPIE